MLDDIWLSFLPGAKIGVLGLNGAGKSSLLRSWPARTTSSSARRFRPTASRSASCRRSRGSIRPRRCSATSRKASPRSRRCCTRYDEVNAKLGEDLSPEEMEKVLDEQAQHAGPDRRVERLGPRLAARARDGRAAPAAAGRRRDDALGRRAAPRRALPAAAAVARPAAARRADQPPRRRVGRLARDASCKDYPGTVVAVTHDRYFLDNVAGWILELDRGHGIPWEGNYSSWLEQKQKRLAQEEKAETRRQQTLERELEWIRMSPRARQAKGKARLNAYEELLEQDTAQKIETRRDLHPARPAPRRRRRRGARAAQGLRRQPAHRRTSTSRCRAAASSA